MVMKEEEYAEYCVVPNEADGEDSLNLTLPMDLSFVGDDAFHIDDFSNEDIAAPITTPSLSSSSTTTDSAFYSSFLSHEDFTIICPSYPDTTAGLQWPPDFGEESPLPIMSTTDGASSVKLEKMTAEDDEESNIMPMVPAISEMERLREVPSKARSKRPRTSADAPPKAWSSSSQTKAVEGEVEVQVKEWKDDVRAAGERRSQQPRRCTHCLVQRTPQWRTGPLGPKTLCNACGVRYKSGRLYPEYRPAKSPTFVRYLHSNSHKKVMELRTNFSADDTSDQEDLNTIVINNINSHRLDLPQTNTSSPLKLKLKFPPPSSSFLTQL